jgi:hypothetical protein
MLKKSISPYFKSEFLEHDLNFAFDFDDFKSLPQNFGLFLTGSKIANFGLGNGKS